MALRSVVYKAILQVADMDRGYYAEHALVVARHPSETDERMMVRVVAFALNATEGLAFGRGLSVDDEPDIWRKDLTGAIETWIEVGLPDEKWLRKACGRAGQVVLYAYGRTADGWWQQNRNKLSRLENLRVFRLDPDATAAAARMAERSMRLQCNVQDAEAWLGNGTEIVRFSPEMLYPII
ncbi:MAG: YaeQ family protein [Pigmentiphaga sp.]|uniref:YaeQ family protein n=1 Tax=Pigmentiphaga sp. TaxID=1977564 RepID=UPI0029BB8030|nr:YaeQ family protein [Pigmentiphaga sp.]MDX3908128.1 YaeQ family protein [Pigmentiphaga sp.]